MKKNDKYYQPLIEEFHVGFECEHMVIHSEEGHQIDLLSKKWKPHTITRFDGKIEPSWYRVKYLDKEDIESLGYKHFKHHPKGVFSAVDYYSGYSAGLTHYHNTNTIVIYEQLQGDIEGETWFRGTIKNKSELKVLMKQLGI